MNVDRCINEKGKVSTNELIDEMVNSTQYISDGGRLYWHDDEQSCWNDITNNAGVNIKTKLPKQYRSQVSSNMVTRIVENLIDHPDIHVDLNHGVNTECLNLLNSVWSIRERKSCEYDKKFYFKQKLNFSYKQTVDLEKEAPNFMAYVKSSLGEDQDKLKLLLQILGYSISPLVGAKKMFFLIGIPNTGKSLILNLIEYVVGKENRSILGLHEFCERFKLIKLSSSIVNLSHEVRNINIKSLDLIKKISANEPILVESKGADPIEIAPTTKLVFCANSMPMLGEFDNQGIVTRLCVLLFNNKIEKADLKLLEKMKKEVDAIFSKAFDELHEIDANNLKFVIPKDSEEFLKQYQREQDSFKQFIEDRCDISPGGKIHTSDLLKFYQMYCKENAFKAVSGCMIKQLIAENYPQITMERFRFDGTNSKYGFVGLKLKNFKEADKEELVQEE
ncbi:DNA primase family protein [Anaerosinus sp.]|uniref:DNA primase family protein n=1 Tax=Selenobaculum sp. TaxID=3074374 RepID=UPI003AB8A01B